MRVLAYGILFRAKSVQPLKITRKNSYPAGFHPTSADAPLSCTADYGACAPDAKGRQTNGLT